MKAIKDIHHALVAAGEHDRAALLAEFERAVVDLEVAANTVARCYTHNPGNFAMALQNLGDAAAKVREFT